MVSLLTFASTAAIAGPPAEEADRCHRFLAAVFAGETQKAVDIEEEQFPQETAADKATKVEKLKKTMDLIMTIGEGLPSRVDEFTDVVAGDSGDTIKRQYWTFPNGRATYVGCAMYALQDGEPYVTLKFEDDLDVLTAELKRAVEGRQRSPPARP